MKDTISIFLVSLLSLGTIKSGMFQTRPAILSSMFGLFFVTSYLFILTNLYLFYALSTAIGILTIPVTAVFYRDEVMKDFNSSVFFFIILLTTFMVLFFFISIIYYRWGSTIPAILVTPVLVEEFNFRYLLQRILLRKYSPYIVVFFQAVLYSLYYSKYVVAGGGAGFPFPYNLIMVTSMFGMGLMYGLLAKVSKNFFLPATLHLTIWSIVPWLPAAIASTIVPA